VKRPLVGLVVNQNVALHRRHSLSRHDYEVWMSNCGLLRNTQRINELEPVAREFLEAGVEVLAIAGGDGTLHATLNAFLPVYGSCPLPPILIVQAGTMNNMSSEIRMMRPGLKVLNELRKGAQVKAVPKIHRMLMRINDHYGFLYGVGFPARLLKRYYEAPRQCIASALLLLSRSIFYAALRPEMAGDLFGRLKARLIVDGNPREEENLLYILASTILQVGLRFKPCHLALNSERAFHLMICSSRLTKLVSRVHRIYSGRPLDVEGCIDALAMQACIEFDAPTPYMVDGELKKDARRHLIRRDRVVSFIVDVMNP
jgi:diacylglycerol kinase family enzyme